ncbi:MAG TPA: tripartite tricarboxylate transporter substrate-binding protein, partial [Reyranella sp.]|nr:tripartite tricarboxylate transporter substrate-binding protein [Reyranella sp.]
MSGLRRRTVLAGTLGTALGMPHVHAQSDWPKGPMRFIVPFPPGGGTDPIARIIAAKLGETTGWQIVVENKPGAAGVIGATVAAKSPADGQTWLVTFDSHILSPGFNDNMPYKDSELFNLMLIGRAPLVIACHPSRPYKDFAEAVADARQRPGKVSIGMLSASQSLLLMTYVKKENSFEPNL